MNNAGQNPNARKLPVRRSLARRLVVPVTLLIIVVAFVGPKLRSFGARAKVGEAKLKLAQIYSLEKEYYTRNGRYGRLDQLGLPVARHIEKHLYRTEIILNKFGFVAVATEVNVATINQRCRRGRDRWQIDQDKHLVNIYDSFVCP